jgi:hypothetical protein
MSNSPPPRPTTEMPRVGWLGWVTAGALLNAGIWGHARVFVVLGSAFLGGMCMSALRRVLRKRLIRQAADQS